MARVGWVAVRADVGAAEQQWLRLSVFDDGWVQVPTFGRAVSAVRSNLRSALLDLVGLVLGLGAAIGCLALAGDTDGTLAVVLRVVGAVLLVGVFGTLLVRSFMLRMRQRERWAADGEDARRLKAAGRLPARAPGAPLWRRADTAQEFSSWLTNTVLIRATDVATVTVTIAPAPTGRSEQVAEVFLHTGTRLRYSSPDQKLGSLLCRFGVAPPDSTSA